MRFEDLDIIAPVLKALKDKNYEKPTTIQEKAIPHVLKRRDILGSAQTGTGKNSRFCHPNHPFGSTKLRGTKKTNPFYEH